VRPRETAKRLKGRLRGYIPDNHDIRKIVKDCLNHAGESCAWPAASRDIAAPGTVRWS
jgi:hypothetical protein